MSLGTEELPDPRHHVYNQMQIRRGEASSQGKEDQSAGDPLGGGQKHVNFSAKASDAPGGLGALHICA